MRSFPSLVLLAVLAGPASAQEPPAGDGPRGSSWVAPGEQRYDEVGYAGIGDAGGLSATSASLPPGSYAEITALDSGRTALVTISPGSPGARIVALSPNAAAALGVAGDDAPVRVRRVVPTPPEIVALREGKAGTDRMVAPEQLLVALRKRLPGATKLVAAAPPPPAAPAVLAPPSAPAPAPPWVDPPGYYVLVTSLADPARARSLAAAIGGTVETIGTEYRVRLGPFADTAGAGRGRAAAAGHGYRNAQIVRID